MKVSLTLNHIEYIIDKIFSYRTELFKWNVWVPVGMGLYDIVVCQGKVQHKQAHKAR